MEIDPGLIQPIPAETKGDESDLYLFRDSAWLQNSEVRYALLPKRGRWHVYMLFLSLDEPIKLLIRYLDHYPSKNKAETFARIFQRGIRKDSRGTLKRDQHDYNICRN
ncbi:MAG: hypothetical protein AAF587_22835 [Bacteroidota bacterium]